MLKNRYYILLLFLVVGLILFSPSFFNLNYFWDDERFVFLNPDILQAPHWYSFWIDGAFSYRSWPLGYWFFWFFTKGFGLYSIVFYKALNIVIHSFNGFLLFSLLKKLKVKYSLVLAFLFLVHPLNVESVSWIFQFLTLISFSFFIMSCLCLAEYVEKGKKYFLLISYLMFLFSLWSKSIALFTPLLFVYFFYYSKVKRSHYFLLIPFFAFSLWCGMASLQGNFSDKKLTSQDKAYLKISQEAQVLEGPTNSESYKKEKEYHTFLFDQKSKLPHKFQVRSEDVMSLAGWHYYAKMIFPYSLQFIYPQKVYSYFFSIFANILVLLCPCLIFLLRKNKNIEILFIPLAVGVFLVPYIGIVDIPFFYWSYVSDRYTYYMLLVLVFMIGFILSKLKSDFQIKTFIIIYGAFLILSNINYGFKFNNPKRLYEEIIQYKQNPLIYSMLFQEYLTRLDAKNSRRVWEISSALFPDDPVVLTDKLRLKSLEHNLGITP